MPIQNTAAGRPSPTLMRVVNAFQAKGVEVHQSATNPRQFETLCPSHADTEASLSIGDGETGVGLQCWAGCERQEMFDAVVQFTGLTPKDFFYEHHRAAPAAGTPHVTLAQLAAAKKLPTESFASFGITDGVTGIHMPYFSETNEVVAVRVRHALKASEGSSWQPAPGAVKAVVSCYGAWGLPVFRRGGELILVEGETDVLTGWAHQLPVIGIPGKTVPRRAVKNTPRLFENIERVFVIEEPDDCREGAFQREVRRALTDQHSPVPVYRMRLPVKDLSELHITVNGNHEAFMTTFNHSYAAALDLASWPEPGRISSDIIRVANWVLRTSKSTFGVKDCFNAAKDAMSWGEIVGAFQELEEAGWIRSLPQERRRGRPSPKYRRNPVLWREAP